MFIKETGYIEMICYAKYAGIDLDQEKYPQIQYSDEQIQQIIDESWNTDDEEYNRIMKIGKHFHLYPSEIYFIFLAVLPFWDSRFGDIFSLFGGMDGRATPILARDMWERNHKQKAVIREDVLTRFFLEEDLPLQPKSHLLSYLSGVRKLLFVILKRSLQGQPKFFSKPNILKNRFCFTAKRALGKKHVSCG